MPSLRETLRKTRSVLLRRGVSADDVDDLLQDAFVRVASYERLQVVKSREAMLMVTAVNLSVDRLRRARRAPFDRWGGTTEQIVDAQPLPDEIAESRARLARLREGLDQLAPTTRRILIAKRIEGRSVVAIAEQEGMSVAAVEKQIARATFKLMKWMDAW